MCRAAVVAWGFVWLRYCMSYELCCSGEVTSGMGVVKRFRMKIMNV